MLALLSVCGLLGASAAACESVGHPSVGSCGRLLPRKCFAPSMSAAGSCGASVFVGACGRLGGAAGTLLTQAEVLRACFMRSCLGVGAALVDGSVVGTRFMRACGCLWAPVVRVLSWFGGRMLALVLHECLSAHAGACGRQYCECGCLWAEVSQAFLS